MNRRRFLAGAGVALSVGIAGRRAARPTDPVVVRVWFSEAAAAHDSLADRVEGYLGSALEAPLGAVEFDFVPSPVALPAEGGKRVLSMHWPSRVVEGAVGMGGVDPVDGVNLLVTDGDPRKQPAGYARPHVAAVTGAGYIARMAPATETPTVVPYSVRAAATQLLLHECGHALGLGHEHGSARRRDDAIVASPMVGSYVWAPDHVRENQLADESACGESFPRDSAAPNRRLALRFTDCAEQALR
ncbi:zinc metalloprotease [Halosimplex salinum]|uniref:peptidase M10A and M12B matrixin and adamalysin n=1 Tax=Halosimplex salinum TaxID=1710538 RepID=UPI000F49AACD|nr:peptidase M10A and M12B matrixin and adamalysin [Halosimplex salinum]